MIKKVLPKNPIMSRTEKNVLRGLGEMQRNAKDQLKWAQRSGNEAEVHYWMREIAKKKQDIYEKIAPVAESQNAARQQRAWRQVDFMNSIVADARKLNESRNAKPKVVRTRKPRRNVVIENHKADLDFARENMAEVSDDSLREWYKYSAKQSEASLEAANLKAQRGSKTKVKLYQELASRYQGRGVYRDQSGIAAHYDSLIAETEGRLAGFRTQKEKRIENFVQKAVNQANDRLAGKEPKPVKIGTRKLTSPYEDMLPHPMSNVIKAEERQLHNNQQRLTKVKQLLTTKQAANGRQLTVEELGMLNDEMTGLLGEVDAGGFRIKNLQKYGMIELNSDQLTAVNNVKQMRKNIRQHPKTMANLQQQMHNGQISLNDYNRFAAQERTIHQNNRDYLKLQIPQTPYLSWPTAAKRKLNTDRLISKVKHDLEVRRIEAGQKHGWYSEDFKTRWPMNNAYVAGSTHTKLAQDVKVKYRDYRRELKLSRHSNLAFPDLARDDYKAAKRAEKSGLRFYKSEVKEFKDAVKPRKKDYKAARKLRE